jgi:hypothetical protein
MLGYGDGDYIHLSYTDGSDTSDPGCLQRRVPSFASGGLPAWESPITLDSRGNGVSAWNLAMEPSTTSGNVTVLMHVPGPDVESRYSTDFGATYPGGNFGFVLNNVPASSAQLLNRASGNLVLVTALNASPPDPSSIFVTRSHVGDPGTWSVPEEFSTHESYGVAFTRIAFDPTRGDRYAVAWADARGSGDYLLRFDAEWRRDPGYPNTDIGFPLAIPGGQTPPAVAEVDGDAEKEIVFGTLDGNVWVVNHDGIVAPGWPVDIGTLPVDAPVAVADLVGNGEFTVVSGTANGQVYAIDPDGNVLPGWPYNMGTGAPVFVSIGALGPPRLHYVVAVSGTKMALIDYWGENFAPAWANIPFGVHMNSAAIGDVDNDGVSEIITAAGPNIYKHRMDNAAFSGLQFPGETFSDSPTLADINGDNKLEIAAPTTSGKMYLLTHELANYSAAWPITVSPGTALTGAAFGQILGTSEPELVFAEAGGLVHVRYSTGVEQAGYPIASGSGVLYMPPMLATVNVSSSNVNIGTTIAVVDGRAHSWRNVPSAGVPGWPRNLPGPVEETFASGDIDNDGRNELVVLGVDFLSVYDVGIAPQSTARNHWPMYGYDAQRTGCLACVEPMSAVGDAPAAPGHATLDVHPNPFNPVATITYEVKLSGPVTLAVYDVGGRLVETLIDGEVRAANRYSISYRANVASGVYFLRLTTGGEEVATKMVLLK